MNDVDKSEEELDQAGDYVVRSLSYDTHSEPAAER